MDGVVAFKVPGDLSWDGAEPEHAAHTSSNTVYFYSASMLHSHFVAICCFFF